MLDILKTIWELYILNIWYIWVILFVLIKLKWWPKEIFWIDIVLWEFWAWKTYNVMREALDYKNQWCFIISNAPYSFVDLKFNSLDDLNTIFKMFVVYFQDTNFENYLKTDNFRPIVFILDESHLYFFSRNFMKNLQDETMITVSQCRKRNILIRFVTQELAQLDSTFRRLVPYVRKYYTWIAWFSFYRDYYMKTDEVDVKNEEKVEVIGKGWFLTPWKLFWNLKYKISDKYKQYHSERWVSRYIVGLKMKYWKNLLDDFTYLDFLQRLYWDDLLASIDWSFVKKDLTKENI